MTDRYFITFIICIYIFINTSLFAQPNEGYSVSQRLSSIDLTLKTYQSASRWEIAEHAILASFELAIPVYGWMAMMGDGAQHIKEAHKHNKIKTLIKTLRRDLQTTKKLLDEIDKVNAKLAYRKTGKELKISEDLRNFLFTFQNYERSGEQLVRFIAEQNQNGMDDLFSEGIIHSFYNKLTLQIHYKLLQIKSLNDQGSNHTRIN